MATTDPLRRRRTDENLPHRKLWLPYLLVALAILAIGGWMAAVIISAPRCSTVQHSKQGATSCYAGHNWGAQPRGHNWG